MAEGLPFTTGDALDFELPDHNGNARRLRELVGTAVSQCWLALVDEAPDEAAAAAELAEPDGAPAGWLAAWLQRAKPVRSALRVDPRIFDTRGDCGWVSLVLVPPGFALPFDDLAVQQARRDVLARPPARAVRRSFATAGASTERSR